MKLKDIKKFEVALLYVLHGILTYIIRHFLLLKNFIYILNTFMFSTCKHTWFVCFVFHLAVSYQNEFNK